MLGLKREIIKERGAAGEVRKGGWGGTERFRLEIDEVMQTGVTRLFSTGTMGSPYEEFFLKGTITTKLKFHPCNSHSDLNGGTGNSF